MLEIRNVVFFLAKSILVLCVCFQGRFYIKIGMIFKKWKWIYLKLQINWLINPILFSWLDILWWSLLYIFLNISEDFEFSWFDSIIQKSLLSKKSQLTTLIDYIHRWIAPFHLINRCCCMGFNMHWIYKYAWAWGIEWNTCVWNE